ncbi:hypothetical protein ACRAWF_41255 [Streptomyces sp. L7]
MSGRVFPKGKLRGGTAGVGGDRAQPRPREAGEPTVTATARP